MSNDFCEEDGLDGLIGKRLSQISHRRAPVDEVMRLAAISDIEFFLPCKGVDLLPGIFRQPRG